MPPVEKRSLLSRSPRSRKSLAEPNSGQALPTAGPATRKRAYSIAPGDNLKTDVARRRSLLRPKGILKPSNQADQTQDTTQDISDAYQNISPTTSLDVSEITGNMSGAVAAEFHTNVHDNQSRRSFGGRRVSFAAHAHVRVFTAAGQNTDSNSSPASSVASSPAPSESSRSPAPRYDKVTSDQRGPHPVHGKQSLLRRSSVPIPQYEEDGEESMDVSADDIPPSTIVTSFHPRLESGSTLDDHNAGHDSEEDGEGEDAEGDMSMTGEFGPGIVSRRRTMSIAVKDRRSSRMRSSIVIPPSENGGETKEFTVSVDRPPPPESDAFRALEAIANGNRSDEDNSAASENGEVDMDVTTAVSRLLAVRESTGGHLPPDDHVEDSFTTTEDSFDGVDSGERTMDVTNLMRSFHASDYDMDDEGDVTMSAASMVGAPISTYPAQTPEPDSVFTATSAMAPEPSVPASFASKLPVPTFSKSSAFTSQSPSNASRASSPAKPTSPIKQPIKQFTAAFAPAHQPLKRPLAPSVTDGPNATVTSPNKRRAIAANESSTRRISVPVPPSPSQNVSSQVLSRKRLSTTARRPSGYYRKSPADVGAQVGATGDSRLSVSTSAPQRRQSVARPASPKKQATVSIATSPVFSSKVPTIDVGRKEEEITCAREASRQSAAIPSPTRGSPSPGSPSVKLRLGAEAHASELISLHAVNDEVVESIEADSYDQAPIPSLTQAEIIDPGQWATTVQGDDVPQDDLAPISVDQFFTMTGIRFMDDMTCPRRSTVHPSQLQRRESNDGEEDTYTLSDYAVAMAVDIAQLETMSWIANDIRSAIDKYKAQYQVTEEDAAKDIPFLFREYATVSEEDREKILYVLKLIKAHTILSAKGSWYEWKRGWVQGLLTNAERTLDNLDADERQLADITKRAEQTIPGLRREYEEIMRELEQERAAVAEIENCDQTFLSELKATIAEQRQELDVYRNDIAEGNTKLARLEETLEDLEDQGRDAKTAIATAQRQMEMQKTSTRAEVFRLRDELKNLQDLHLWRATQLNAELIEMIYDSKYRVTIPCRRYLPIPEALDVAPLEDQSQADDDFPLVTQLMYQLARRKAAQNHENKLTLRMIVQRLTDFWASYAQLRWQLSFIIIKYPLSFQLIPAGSKIDDAEGFKATATLLLSKKTSKALISFHFDSKLLNYWPVSLELLKFDVSIAYGMADPKVVSEALQTRLSEASPAENHACLVDACMEVVSRYS